MKEQTTDIGDYMKVFACTAVMMQSVLSLVLLNKTTYADQNVIGVIYNLVKFTAPAFIFGILYTTTRTTAQNSWHNYPQYFKNQWSALFIPTICWTLLYLLIFPQVQQVKHFSNIGSFLWQFVNGNAAPHLWYNTMMLQFILLMPLFWSLTHFVTNYPSKIKLVVFLTIICYGFWIYFYDLFVFHGPKMQQWYLLDRFFFSFIIYAIFGVLAWVNRKHFEIMIQKNVPILVGLFFIASFWTNYELFSFGYPLKLTNAPYYKPSMVVYALVVIALIAALAIHQLQIDSPVLPIFHFLATYAYRAYLSNVFWLQIIWHFGGQSLANKNALLAIICCYLLTWGLSFTSAYLFHRIWSGINIFISRA